MKKSKLAIKHYHGKELEKIGKTSNSFPLYVMVRYKNVKTKFASRLGMLFVKEAGSDAGALASFNRELVGIIAAEEKHIELLRDYFEDRIGVDFVPSMIVNESFEKAALEKVVDYFDLIFEGKELRDLVAGVHLDLSELLDAAGPTRFLSGVKHLDHSLFQRLMTIEEVKELFGYFEIFKSLHWPEVNRLQFRMTEIEGGDDVFRLKAWLDEKFDSEMRHFYNLKPIEID
jgi:hypothetical protein